MVSMERKLFCFFNFGIGLTVSIIIFFISPKASALTPSSFQFEYQPPQEGRTKLLNGQVLVAKNKKKSSDKSPTRAKRLTKEKAFKSGAGASTKLDFDAVDISGQRKTPLGTLVSQSKADLEYDFVKIRLRWHPEMVQSAATLESGQSN
ncbi:MAG: hypothetical protein R3B45_07995 [Bdellovibrionota bacterium]